MKHTLKLLTLNDSLATFGGHHQPVERPIGRQVGSAPYGPFWINLGASMYREDWEGAGSPLELEVDL